MKILFADANRDLLAAYREVLTLRGHEVSTAFDGTQVIRRIGEEGFDFAVLNQQLPRVDTARIVTLLRQERIPHILLLDRPISGRLLRQAHPANAYLSFPFLPAELAERIERVAETARSGETLTWGDVRVDAAQFRFADEDVYLTDGELTLLRSLIRGEGVDVGYATPYITALNAKLQLLRRRARIEYAAEKGYRLVNDYE